ncbi:hypothetical protein EV361DRAFT_617466 [Lentinula raphanica]|nr:hypothetical protein EV361DRAFT_617466 [Lentinula raphanica]
MSLARSIIGTGTRVYSVFEPHTIMSLLAVVLSSLLLSSAPSRAAIILCSRFRKHCAQALIQPRNHPRCTYWNRSQDSSFIRPHTLASS